MMDNHSHEILQSKTISLQTFKVMADPVRARLVALFSEGPTTVQRLAGQLGVPLTRLYYHVHLLEQHGLIQVVDQQPRGGTIEKVYATTARSFLIDRAEFETQPQKALEQANILADFALGETARMLRKSVAGGSIDLQQTAPHPRALQIRRGLGRISRERAQQLHQRLVSVMDEFTAPDDPDDGQGGEYWLALAFFPIRFDETEA